MLGSRDIAITLRALVGDFVTPIQTAGNELKTFGREAVATIETIEQKGENLSHVWKAMFEAFLGVEMIDGLKKIAEAADQASLALETAARITKNLGHDFDPGEVEDWLKRLAASAQGGGYAITEMRKSMQALSATGATEGQQKQMLVNVIGLAAARGEKDLAEATHLAMMAAEGHVEILSRYGLQVKKANGELMSFSEVMTNWNKLVAGAAEERAKGLEGAFGRVTNATNSLAVAFGKALMPEFVGAANAIAKVISAIAGLPPWLLAAAAGAAFTVVSLTALGLMLPIVTKGFVFLKDGVSLAWAAMSIGPKLIGFVLMALVDLVTWLGLAREAFTTLTIAEWLSQAPLIGIIAAIVAVVAALALIYFNLDKLGHAWANFCNFAASSWQEFVNNVLGSSENLKRLLIDIAAIMFGGAPGAIWGSHDLGDMMSTSMPKMRTAIYNGIKGGMDAGVEYAKNVWKNVVGFFGSALGSLKMPNIDWSGLGGPGKIKASDLAAWFAPIDAMLAAAKHRVEEAQNALQETAAKLAVLRDKRDPYKPLTQSNVAEEQTLERQELERTLKLREAIKAQRDAELKAAQLEHALMGQVTGKAEQQSKAHAEIAKRMNEHVSAASKLNGEFIKLGGTLAKLGRDIQHAFDPLIQQQLALEQISRGAARDKAVFGVQQAAQTDRNAFARDTALGQPLPEFKAQHDLDQANFARTIAKLNLHLAELDFNAARAAAALEKPEQAARTMAAAQNTLNAAILAHQQTMSDVRIAHLKLTDAIEQARFSVGQFAADLIQKLNVPGLTVARQMDAAGNATNGISFAFNPTSFLIAAAEKSKSFADVMNVVNQLMKVFAQLIDAFRPVIDAVLQAVGFVANIFIDLYNVIARILRAFGIHVALLDRINVDFNKLDSTIAPFISIVHDIPTMNELASGRIGTLSPTPTSYSNLSQVQQPTIDALKSPDMGGGLLGVLLKILEGILALKLVSALFGSGGLFSMAKNLFGGGAGGAAGSGGLATAILGTPGGNGVLAGRNGLLGGTLNTQFGASTIGKSVAPVAAGIIAGDVFGHMMGGGSHVTWGEIGGGLGGAVGSFFGGPVGGWIGAGLGSLVGSMFGKAAPNAHDNPDLAGDVSSYGQGLANLGGSGGYDSAPQYMANGQGFSENAALAQQLGGHGEVNFLSQYIAKTGGKGLDANLTSEFAGATGFSYLKDGMVQLSNGVTKYWSDLVADASTAIKEATASITPSFQALSDSAQSISQNISSAGNELVGSITNAGAGAANALAVVTRSVTGGDVAITQNITHNGDINSAGDAMDLAMFHGDALDRAVRARQYSLDRIAI
ncbi:MAG: hypothetical protein JWN27_2890 [Candidatus Eremiobacteraeota bacterium]|nr:hypothetical protein [Candidatus Eremiobacteraeota bacterium]